MLTGEQSLEDFILSFPPVYVPYAIEWMQAFEFVSIHHDSINSEMKRASYVIQCALLGDTPENAKVKTVLKSVVIDFEVVFPNNPNENSDLLAMRNKLVNDVSMQKDAENVDVTSDLDFQLRFVLCNLLVLALLRLYICVIESNYLSIISGVLLFGLVCRLLHVVELEKGERRTGSMAGNGVLGLAQKVECHNVIFNTLSHYFLSLVLRCRNFWPRREHKQLMMAQPVV